MKVSVAICTYNGEKYIEEQLRSILEQTIPIDEIVLRDDGSTDNTLPIASKIASEYPDVSFHISSNPINEGVSINFDNAILDCTGDLVFLSDQDDIWMPDKVKTIVQWFEAHPNKDVVFTDAQIVDNNGQLCCDRTAFELVGFNKAAQKMFDDGLGPILFIRNLAVGATMAIRRKQYVSIAHFLHQTHYIHDGILAILALDSESLGYMNETLIKYRQHPDQQIGLSFLMDNPFPADIFFQTYLFDSTEAIPLLLNFPLQKKYKQTLRFLSMRKKQLENPCGIVVYFYWIAIGRYSHYMKSHAKNFYRYDCRYWLTLRWQRLVSKTKKEH